MVRNIKTGKPYKTMSNKLNTAKKLHQKLKKKRLCKEDQDLIDRKEFQCNVKPNLSVLIASTFIAISSNITNNHHVIPIINILEYNSLDLVIRNSFTTNFRCIGNLNSHVSNYQLPSLVIWTLVIRIGN